jgi:hypothetical protein
MKPSSSETDNTEDEATSLATLDNIETWPTFELLTLKRDYSINNLGQLVTFTASDNLRIYITGGLTVGELSSKGHVYDVKKNQINVQKDLQMPVIDTVRHVHSITYYGKQLVYVLGTSKVQMFDLFEGKWHICS